MKEVKKFTTFTDLKSFEKESLNQAVSIKKHDEFAKLLRDIKAIKDFKKNQGQ